MLVSERITKEIRENYPLFGDSDHCDCTFGHCKKLRIDSKSLEFENTSDNCGAFLLFCFSHCLQVGYFGDFRQYDFPNHNLINESHTNNTTQL